MNDGESRQKEISSIKDLAIVQKCRDLLYLIEMARTRNPEVDNNSLETAVNNLLNYSLTLCPEVKGKRNKVPPLEVMKAEGIDFFDECLGRHKKKWIPGVLLGVTETEFVVRTVTKTKDGDEINAIFVSRIKRKREKELIKKEKKTIEPAVSKLPIQPLLEQPKKPAKADAAIANAQKKSWQDFQKKLKK
jgi:hypothetical protein